MKIGASNVKLFKNVLPRLSTLIATDDFEYTMMDELYTVDQVKELIAFYLFEMTGNGLDKEALLIRPTSIKM